MTHEEYIASLNREFVVTIGRGDVSIDVTVRAADRWEAMRIASTRFERDHNIPAGTSYVSGVTATGDQ